MWLQVIVGLGLYFGLSPVGLKAMKVAGAMKDPTARFFGMEHVGVMILAAILAQVGRIALKKAPSDTLKHKKAFTYFAIALVLVLLMIPWGIWNPARPLFRF
jgi:membrane protein DedA with SNARE-associated domain